jgi:hypothetical protein
MHQHPLLDGEVAQSLAVALSVASDEDPPLA